MNKRNIVVVIAIIVIVSTAGIIIFLNSGKKSYDDFVDINTPTEELYEHSTSVPDVIANNTAWVNFTDSQYYDPTQEYIFRSVDDRVVSELYGDDYDIYIEYVFEELTIDVNDHNGNNIIRFE